MSTRTRTEAEVRSSHLRAFRLPSVGAGDRVALVPEQAVLLAGDQVAVSVRVPAGRSLEIVEPGGTVAYAMRGRRARWDVSVVVEEGASLVWLGEPFVVAEGADVARSLTVALGPGSRLVLRETLVLGRSGEGPGRLRTQSSVLRDGSPLLVEELDCVTGLGPHRVLDQVLRVGTPSRPGDHSLVLESGDVLDRWLGARAHESPLGPAQSSASPE
jgi:urease accessory protein